MQDEQVLFSLPLNKLEPIIKQWVKDVIDNSTPQMQTTTTTETEPYIYGISGLAKFLKVSTVTAQKIKNSGKFPFSQSERTIIIKKSDVLEGLKPKKQK